MFCLCKQNSSRLHRLINQVRHRHNHSLVSARNKVFYSRNISTLFSDFIFIINIIIIFCRGQIFRLYSLNIPTLISEFRLYLGNLDFFLLNNFFFFLHGTICRRTDLSFRCEMRRSESSFNAQRLMSQSEVVKGRASCLCQID